MLGYGRLGYGAGHMIGGGFGFGGLIFGFFLFALVVALIIWFVVGRKHGMRHAAMYNQMQGNIPTTSAEDAALAIARERLAKGEIDAEQYNAIVTALKS